MDTIVIKIKGLRSAACVSSIEYKLQQIPDMEAVHVDFVTSEALLRSFTQINIDDVKQVIEENGFTMELPEKPASLKKQRPKKDKSIFLCGFIFLVLTVIEFVIFFFRYALELEYVQGLAVLETALVWIVLLLGIKHILSGLKQLTTDIPHMDSLLAVAGLLAAIYSSAQAYYVLQGYASEYDLYCAAVAGAMFFTLYGKQVTNKAEKIFTEQKLTSFKLPKAKLLINDREYTIPGKHLLAGDTIMVYEGSIIPADGIVLDGNAELDEAEITGSSENICKLKGAEVFAETLVKTGSLKIKVTASNKNVRAVQLWRMAQKYSKEPKSMQKLRRTDKIAAVFLPVVASISVIAGLSWYFYSGDAHLALKVLVSVMLGAYPCALGFAHSGALLSINKLANEQGIVFKNSAVLERLHKISLAVFSKHNEKTSNCMELVQLTALNAYVENTLPDFLPDGRVRSVVDLQPKEKAELIQSLRWGGERTLVYGNKISDMPLLASGDVGVAKQLSAAEQYAQILLPQDEPKLILNVIEISKKLNKIYKRNSILALTFNLLCLPLAIGAWHAFGGYLLEPIVLAVVMFLSGISVIFSSKCI